MAVEAVPGAFGAGPAACRAKVPIRTGQAIGSCDCKSGGPSMGDLPILWKCRCYPQVQLWLASVHDAFSNKVVGWHTTARADTDLAPAGNVIRAGQTAAGALLAAASLGVS